jgi:hypothetical protein
MRSRASWTNEGQHSQPSKQRQDKRGQQSANVKNERWHLQASKKRQRNKEVSR